MGRIPEYSRNRLASSVVGGAAEDRSGEIYGGMVTNAAAVLAKKQEEHDTIEAGRLIPEYTAARYAMASKLRQESLDNPTAYVEQAKEWTAKLQQEFSGRATTAGARKIFDMHAAAYLKTAYMDDVQWAEKAKNVKDVDHIMTTSQGISDNASRAGNVSTLVDNLIALDEHAKTSASLLSQEGKNKLKQDKRVAVNAYFDAKINQDPVQALRELDDKKLDSYLSVSDRENIRDRARRMVPYIPELKAIDNYVSLSRQADEETASAVSTPGGYRAALYKAAYYKAQADAQPATEEGKAKAREFTLKAQMNAAAVEAINQMRVKVVSDLATVQRFDRDIEQITTVFVNGQKAKEADLANPRTAESKALAKRLDEMLELRAKVATAFTEGKINRQDYLRLDQELSSRVSYAVQNNAGQSFLGLMDTPWERTLDKDLRKFADAASKTFSGKFATTPVQSRGDLMSIFFDEIESAGKDYRNLTETEMRSFSEQAKKRYIIQTRGVDIDAMRKQIGQYITVLRPSGETATFKVKSVDDFGRIYEDKSVLEEKPR